MTRGCFQGREASGMCDLKERAGREGQKLMVDSDEEVRKLLPAVV